MAQVIYKMLSNGGTTGAVTGKTRIWSPGQRLEAPEGEFDHLPQGSWELAPSDAAEEHPARDAETATAPPAPEKAVAARKQRNRR